MTRENRLRHMQAGCARWRAHCLSQGVFECPTHVGAIKLMPATGVYRVVDNVMVPVTAPLDPIPSVAKPEPARVAPTVPEVEVLGIVAKGARVLEILGNKPRRPVVPPIKQ
jgi:hypothetical protein